MKKAKFFIYGTFADGGKKLGLKEQAGYIFVVDNIVFGCHKTGGEWTITHINTGIKVCGVKKRMDAPAALTPGLLDKIRAAEQRDNIRPVMELVAAAYRNIA